VKKGNERQRRERHTKEATFCKNDVMQLLTKAMDDGSTSLPNKLNRD
jgi:hypothetical protein